MTPRLRKLVLSVHLTFSVGWIGAVAAYLSLDIATATSRESATLRASYLAMELVVRYVIVPFALGALLSGVAISLGTRWGLFRHYWVLVSLVLTILATLVLLSETRTVSRLASLAGDPNTSSEELAELGNTLVHSVGGMVILLAILVLNVYKPRGLTRYGWRRQNDLRAEQDAADAVEG